MISAQLDCEIIHHITCTAFFLSTLPYWLFWSGCGPALFLLCSRYSDSGKRWILERKNIARRRGLGVNEHKVRDAHTPSFFIFPSMCWLCNFLLNPSHYLNAWNRPPYSMKERGSHHHALCSHNLLQTLMGVGKS